MVGFFHISPKHGF